MKTIEEQIHAYSSYADDQMDWVEAGDLATPPAAGAPSVRRGWAAFAVAAVFVLLVVGLVPFLLLGSDSPSAVEPTAPPTTGPALPTTSVAAESEPQATAPDVPVTTTLPATTTLAPSAPVAANGLEFTGVSLADRHNGSAPPVEHGGPPITVDSPVGEITWVRYDSSRYPTTVAALPDGGYVAWYGLRGTETAVVWYTEDGQEWLNWSNTDTLYANHRVHWVIGDWAVTYPLGSDPADVADTLWKRSEGVWSQVSLPDGASRVSRPVGSDGMEMMTATGGPVDYVIASTEDGAVYYEAPWKPTGTFELPTGSSTEDTSRSMPTVEIQPNPQGGFVALRWAPLEAWTTSDGYSWVSVDEFPADTPDVYGFAFATFYGTLWLETWSMASEGARTTYSYWSSTDGVNWIQAAPPTSPDGENLLRDVYWFYGAQRWVDTPVAVFMAYATYPSFRASLDNGATWVDVPGPPWVEENSNREMEASYRATEDFLFAVDRKEGWIGTFND